MTKKEEETNVTDSTQATDQRKTKQLAPSSPTWSQCLTEYTKYSNDNKQDKVWKKPRSEKPQFDTKNKKHQYLIFN